MPPEFHLRLVHALCNDVINCYNMKAEISGRCVARTLALTRVKAVLLRSERITSTAF
jgi:hypothetical protein